ncbi:hypothetical protein ACFQL4_27170 [Halosimplex aquaticum]
MDIPRSIREDLESRKNVIGTAIGPKRVGDRPTDEEALVVLVSEKLPETHLAEVDRIPSEIEFDDTRIRTDVQEVGDVRTQATTAQPAEEPDRERRWRPAPAGVSLGHPEITAGTLGSPPLQTEDGKTVVLTNAHVAAPIDTAQPGDNILQPGPADGGSDDDVIGTLVEGARSGPTSRTRPTAPSSRSTPSSSRVPSSGSASSRGSPRCRRTRRSRRAVGRPG